MVFKEFGCWLREIQARQAFGSPTPGKHVSHVPREGKAKCAACRKIETIEARPLKSPSGDALLRIRNRYGIQQANGTQRTEVEAGEQWWLVKAAPRRMRMAVEGRGWRLRWPSCQRE